MKNALVTGATGYIGSNLVRRLISQKWNVAAIVRPSSDRSSLAALSSDIRCYEYDGTVISLAEAVESARPDVVFHLASCFLWNHTPDQVSDLISSNVLFGIQLTEAMCSNGCQRLVNTGTAWQHYHSTGYSPVNLYAATKQAFEVALQYFVEVQNLKVVTLKLSDTYGPNDPRPKLFSVFERAAASTEPVGMSPGAQLLDIVYIDDVIDAFLVAAARVCEHPVGHEQFAVASGSPTKLRDIAVHYERATGRRLNIHWGGRPYRSREVMRPWSGMTLPGWKPKVGLGDGIRRLCKSSTLVRASA